MDDEAAKEAAIASAESWLGLLDSGSYKDCWQTAAASLRKAVGRRQLQKSLLAARKPLGETTQRAVAKTEYRTELPGAPDGEYVVVQYESKFEHKQHAIETITPMKEPDGEWRVSGYYIK